MAYGLLPKSVFILLSNQEKPFVMIHCKHDERCKGDMSFMEALLPKDYIIQHMDSYNHEGKKRFQGCFGLSYQDMVIPMNDCPLAILKIAKSYQTYLCTQCGRNPHIVWTIWFD